MPSLTALCLTRWTVKAKSFESVLLNYEPLLIVFPEITSSSDSSTSNFKVRPKANEILKSLETFDILFGGMLGERYFGITDSLSHSLQGKRVASHNTIN